MEALRYPSAAGKAAANIISISSSMCLLNKEIMQDETSFKYFKVLKKYLEVLVKMGGA